MSSIVPNFVAGSSRPAVWATGFFVGLIVVCFSLPREANAQVGVFAEDGFGAEIGFTTGSEVTSTRGRIGIAQPIFEIGAGFSRRSEDASPLTVVDVGPYVAFYPFRQGGMLPLSVSISGSAKLRTFSTSERVNTRDEAATNGSALSIGIGLFRSFRAGEALRIIPTATVKRIRGLTRTGGLGEVQSEVEWGFTADLGLAFIYEFSDRAHVALTPTAYFVEEGSSFGVSATFVIPGEAE